MKSLYDDCLPLLMQHKQALDKDVIANLEEPETTLSEVLFFKCFTLNGKLCHYLFTFVLFQTCMSFILLLNTMSVTRQLTAGKTILWKSMGAVNCLAIFCVQQRQETHTGLEHDHFYFW